MPSGFIERSAYQPAAMSKIYTSGNVNMFEECFQASSAGKHQEVATACIDIKI